MHLDYARALTHSAQHIVQLMEDGRCEFNVALPCVVHFSMFDVKAIRISRVKALIVQRITIPSYNIYMMKSDWLYRFQ